MTHEHLEQSSAFRSINPHGTCKIPAPCKTSVTAARWLWWASLGGFFALATMVEPSRPSPLDATVGSWVGTGAVAYTRLVWLALSWPGEHLGVILPLVLAASTALWLASDCRSAIVAATLFLAASGTNLLVKGVVARSRPVPNKQITFSLDSYSFPSGHTVQYTCLFGFLAWWCGRNVRRPWWRRALTTAAAATVVLAGPARVLLQAHWATDVLGGYLYAYLWLGAGIVVARRSE